MQPGSYTWRTKDADYPVTVLEFLGKGPDGREYAKIEESLSAVPVDELIAKKVLKSISIKPISRPLF